MIDDGTRALAALILPSQDAASPITGMVTTITSVTAGGASDGNAKVVLANGLDVPYLSSYAPVAGHVVLVALLNKSPIIIGRIIGRSTY